MKQHFQHWILGLTILGGGFAWAQTPPVTQAQETTSSRAALQEGRSNKMVTEKELVALKDQLAAQDQQLARLQLAIEEIGRGAAELQSALSQAEEEGFTSGINYQSRITLIKGWRSYLDTVSKAATPKKATAPKGRTRR